MMRVFLLSTSYPSDSSDWRGVFIRHVVGALARVPGVDVDLWAPPGESPSTVTAVTTPDESAWLAKLMAAGGISHLMRGGGLRAVLAPLTLVRLLARAYRRQVETDIYHVNWLQCALPLPANNKPALITVLGNDMKLLKLPFMVWALRRVMRRRKIALCPNAEWMEEPLRTMFGSTAEIVPVSFGIDPCWYAVERTSRAQVPVRWLVVTRLTADKLGPLFEWSRDFFSRDGHELHLFGPMQEQVNIPDWVHYHGAATPRQLAEDWFPNASGLISLSRHAEGRPQVMLEAMAAGLPIIASRMSAHATIVSHGQTGFLCESPIDYGTALEHLLDQETNVRFGLAARSLALENFGTWDDCARRYIRIYERLIGCNASEQ